MATRGIIVRATEYAFTGRYHHWDSYPSGLGKTLYHLHKNHFQGDTSALLNLLLDEHPAGWSNIVDSDFTLTPGFVDVPESEVEDEDQRRPHCYCHGTRHEQEQTITSFSGAWASDAQYMYLIDEQTALMTIFHHTGGQQWSNLKTIDLRFDSEPDWTQLDNAC